MTPPDTPLQNQATASRNADAAVTPAAKTPQSKKRVLVFGATGTIGQAVVRTLRERGYTVVCFVRRNSRGALASDLTGVTVRRGNVTDMASLRDDAFCGERFDAVVSCLASRTGVAEDAWAIDHDAHLNILRLAWETGTPQFILLSAICVQKPKLAFQHAKLAFEAELQASGLTYSIVRPTAYFKSLSGQLDRLRAGKPFLVFGDGTLTSCKPISDSDLANYIADCLEKPNLWNKILPIGGPGPGITPRQQGEMLFRNLGMTPRFRQVPIAMLDVIAAGLDGLGRLVPSLRSKAELARIGRYYATESMLVLDPETGRYDSAATPSYGSETLEEFYQSLARGEASVARGEHAVF